MARDLDAWFELPLVTQAETADAWPDPRDHPVPPILSAARRDFSPLIDREGLREKLSRER